MTQTATSCRTVPLAELPTLAGQRLGPSRPLTVTQEQVDGFADVTRDEQWIHVDAERAARGPFGVPIAHGYLTMSLATAMLWDLLEVPDAAQVLNYGLDRVRFPAPVPVGSTLRLTADVDAVTAIEGGYQLAYTGTIAAEGRAKPVCVLQALLRYYRGADQ